MSASPAPPTAPAAASTSASPAPPSATASASTSTPAAASTAKKAAPTAPKPTNVFTSDGSFLDRFKKTADNEDKAKQEAALARKKAADARFKNRGKRAAPVAGEDGEPSTKRPAKDPDAGLTPYQREVKRLESRSLKDEGYGTRPTLK